MSWNYSIDFKEFTKELSNSKYENVLNIQKHLASINLNVTLANVSENTKSQLNDLLFLSDFIFLDCLKGNLQTIMGVHGFPFGEAHSEICNSVYFVSIGFYKSAMDSIRKALELYILTVNFITQIDDDIDSKSINDEKTIFDQILEKINPGLKKQKEWIKSSSNTPYFSQMLKEIFRLPRYSDYSKRTGFEKRILEFYHLLSDYSHTKGKIFSYNGQPGAGTIDGVFIINVSEEKFEHYVLQLQKLYGIVIELLVLYNPIIFKIIPEFEKLEDKLPLGFIPPGFVELIHRFFTTEYFNDMQTILNDDGEIEALSIWITDLVRNYNE